MKTIASINFKGGAGKTTVTWLLAKYISEKLGKKTLVVDIDAQMSLTLAIQEEKWSAINNKFTDSSNDNHKTLLKVIELYEKNKGEQLNISLNSLIYKLNDNLHLIPSTIDLYWFEYDITDMEKVTHFVNAFLHKMENNSSFNYEYVLFDCPPYFNALSYSVLSCANMVLIPVNPDSLAKYGIQQFILGLNQRLKPIPTPNISVFLNKAKTISENHLSQDSKNYLIEIKKVKNNLEKSGIKIEVLDSFIPDCKDMKSALPSTNLHCEYEEYLKNIWVSLGKTI